MNKKQFVKKIKPHILRCRPGDWEHAKRVAKWTEILGVDRDDLLLLLTSTYIHDIGWRDVVDKEKLTFKKLLKFEPQANKNSEIFIKEVLKKLDYSYIDIKTILRLVKAVDKHKASQEDEAVIVDSDGLSKLDINHLKEKYKTDKWMNMYNLWNSKFPNRIQTDEAKKLYPSLLCKLKSDIAKEQKHCSQ